jgi:RecQ zinc-binding
LYYAESDFDKYYSDFYLGGLKATAQDAVRASMQALKRVCQSSTCRRRAVLSHFGEVAPDCGICDVCCARAQHGEAVERDFGYQGARVILTALQGLSPQGLSQITKVLGGTATLEPFRYRPGVQAESLNQQIQEEKAKVQSRTKLTIEYYKNLMPLLVQKGFVAESQQSAKGSDYQRTWTVFSLTPQGSKALRQESSPIMLPVPESVRELERQEAAKREKTLQELASKGVSKDKLPAEEVENGDGTVIQAYKKWHRYRDAYAASSPDRTTATPVDPARTARGQALDELLATLELWRLETAQKHRMAPGAVLAEHLMVSIAYTTATMPSGMKMDRNSLTDIGVRTKEIESLEQALADWVEQHQPTAPRSPRAGSPSAVRSPTMVLPKGVFTPPSAFRFSVYKPAKKTGKMVWENSYERYQAGESVQAIAVKPDSGRQPIQAATVVDHLFTALLYGRPLNDLRTLAAFHEPPNQQEWEELMMAERTANVDVLGDPSCSGPNGGKFTATGCLLPIMGEEFAAKAYVERTPKDHALFGRWCRRLNWYTTFRRIGYEPDFGDDSA